MNNLYHYLTENNYIRSRQYASKKDFEQLDKVIAIYNPLVIVATMIAVISYISVMGTKENTLLQGSLLLVALFMVIPIFRLRKKIMLLELSVASNDHIIDDLFTHPDKLKEIIRQLKGDSNLPEKYKEDATYYSVINTLNNKDKFAVEVRRLLGAYWDDLQQKQTVQHFLVA